MGVAIAVTSGGGGTGKSTVAAGLARALSERCKTLLWEPTPGARCCDALLAADGVAYDTADVLSGKRGWSDACVEITPSLSLLSSSADYGAPFELSAVRGLLSTLCGAFDFVVLDLSHDALSLQLAASAAHVLFCCTPDALSADRCERAAGYVRQFAAQIASQTSSQIAAPSSSQIAAPSSSQIASPSSSQIAAQSSAQIASPSSSQPAGSTPSLWLAVDRVPLVPYERARLELSLSELIDRTGLALGGVIPETDALRGMRASGGALFADCLEVRVFGAFAERLQGRSVPLQFR